MLEPLRSILSSHRLILASGSPRRREILNTALPNFNIEVIPSEAEENLDRNAYKGNPWTFAEDTAVLKAKAILQKLDTDNKTIVISADTVVTLDNVIFGKPKSDEEAEQMLAKFSGKTQQVYSGVCICMGKEKQRIFHACTQVSFDDLSPEVIKAYVKTGEPSDKAGAYGIQGMGGTLIKSIQGDYFNVVGFPLHLFCKNLQSLLQ